MLLGHERKVNASEPQHIPQLDDCALLGWANDIISVLERMAL